MIKHKNKKTIRFEIDGRSFFAESIEEQIDLIDQQIVIKAIVCEQPNLPKYLNYNDLIYIKNDKYVSHVTVKKNNKNINMLSVKKTKTSKDKKCKKTLSLF